MSSWLRWGSRISVLPREEGLVRAEHLMRRALEIARATPAGDVPVGAVLFGPDGCELATGTNRREADRDPTAHAEMLAIRRGVGKHGDSWRLTGCTLVVTLEPCTMCAGAVLGARVGELIFGAFEPKTGACGSLIDAVRAPGQLHRPAVRAGVLEAECAGLLEDFFGSLR
ncbi:nucleoside deaminase [Corynebacterium sp. YIM 101645]|uniref:tRNA-specific adenosine deaminase n=1 Tax=Corynebacterium lemuris TaxID=1859292 RepID=A0ABT2FSQ7_9CORY|nr:nucleoside deaminase [Corynebacterium lemuris]MCS5478253.1 nucleoside deaminase [Corynebacterium lemuris]